ncbi:Os12g0282400, partial [Oryza sativa Japonica Group]
IGINHRRPRSVTVNTALTKLRARGVPLDIHFPRQFGKVCGRHASFKSEVTVCVRQEAPLKVKKWKNIEKAFHGTSSSIWTSLMVYQKHSLVFSYNFVVSCITNLA